MAELSHLGGPHEFWPAVRTRVMAKLKYIDSQFAGCDYLMGKQFTVADGDLFTR